MFFFCADAARAIPESLTKRHVHHCQNCREAFDDAVVKSQLQKGLGNLNCPYCDHRTPLLNLLIPPIVVSTEVTNKMESNAKAGRRRITSSWVIEGKKAQEW